MKLAGTGAAPAACPSSKVSAENHVHVFVFACVPVCAYVYGHSVECVDRLGDLGNYSLASCPLLLHNRAIISSLARHYSYLVSYSLHLGNHGDGSMRQAHR